MIFCREINRRKAEAEKSEISRGCEDYDSYRNICAVGFCQLESEESQSPDKESIPADTMTEEEEEEEEVFPYDDNIPSIPSIPTLSEPPAKNGPLAAYRRRNLLLRMISDPKCYNPRVLKSLCHEKRNRNETAKQHFRTGAHGRGDQPERVESAKESDGGGTSRP